MKKIFTLIFSLGLLTAAFAQGGHPHRNYNSNNGSGNQSWYQGDQQKYGNDQEYQATPYSNSDNWNYQSNDRRNEHRYGFGNRDDMRGNFDDSRFDDRNFHKGMNSRHSKTYGRRSGLQIFFSFGSHHK